MARHIPGLDDPRSSSQILDEVHKSLYAKYKQNTARQEQIDNANFLTEFLSAWKKFANGADDLGSNIFTADLMRQIQARFPPQITNLFKFKNISGKQFEQQMSKFIYALLTGTGNGINMSMENAIKQINVGSQAADSVFGILDTSIVDTLAEYIIQQIKTQTDEHLQKEYRKALQRIESIRNNKFGLTAYTAQVSQGKIDINANKIAVNWHFTAFELQNSGDIERAITLLAKAKITAKNYGTDWYTENIIRRQKMGWTGVDIYSLHFGQTNLYKVLLMVMGSLGYSQNLIASVYYSSIGTNNEAALRHFQHIRAVYEITGFGQVLIGDEYKELQEADYLIWNDPSSVIIVVRSTADIIAQIFDGIFEENYRDLNLSRSISIDYRKL